MVIIPYEKRLDIRNIENAGKIKGARFLEVIESHEPGVLIACRWLRKEPKTPSSPSAFLVEFPTGARAGA